MFLLFTIADMINPTGLRNQIKGNVAAYGSVAPDRGGNLQSKYGDEFRLGDLSILTFLTSPKSPSN